MNYMKQIAQMLGVELGEEFKIKDPKNGEILNIIFEFDNSGLVRRAPRLEQIWMPDSEGLHQLLIGGFEIVKKPWKPSRGLRYYYVTPIKTLDHTVFDSSSYWDVMAYTVGNCFRTKEEITPEVLEETWQRCYGAYFQDDKQDGAQQ